MPSNQDALFVDPALLKQAERLCHQRVQKNSEDPSLQRSLAEVQRKLGNLEAAAQSYQRLSRLSPEDPEAGYVNAVLAGTRLPTPPTGVRASPFVLLRDFLPAGFHDALLPFFVSMREDFVPVVSDEGHYDPDVRQTLTCLKDWEGKRRFRACLEKVIPNVITRLYLPPFTIHSYTIQVRAYQDGHFFKTHRDAPPGTSYARRMVNFVYYFHRLPKKYSGGDLLLFDTDPDADRFDATRFTRVVPEHNSIIFFPPNYYHCVIPVRCPSEEFADCRFVINGHVNQPGLESHREAGNAHIEESNKVPGGSEPAPPAVAGPADRTGP